MKVVYVLLGVKEAANSFLNFLLNVSSVTDTFKKLAEYCPVVSLKYDVMVADRAVEEIFRSAFRPDDNLGPAEVFLMLVPDQTAFGNETPCQVSGNLEYGHVTFGDLTGYSHSDTGLEMCVVAVAPQHVERHRAVREKDFSCHGVYS